MRINKMKIIIPLIITFLFMQCKTNKMCEEIEITGTAINLKIGAAVRDSLKGFYYIDNLNNWDKATLGKKVLVQGCMKRNKYITSERKDSTIQMYKPSSEVNLKKIINAKWTIIN